jgi:hypothetical protein
MTDKQIKTTRTGMRSPGIAFMLTLFFTGLGQVYNGDLARGAAICLIKALPLLALPAWAALRRPSSSIKPFIMVLVIVLAITIASSLEALFRARRRKDLPVRVYNSTPFYVAFAVVQKIILTLAVLAVSTFFMTGRVKDTHSGPLLERGDILLAQRFLPEGFRRGDMVLLQSGSIARVMALEDDAIKYDNNIFYVNGRSLPLGYLADGIISRFSDQTGDVISESNDGRKYPVRFKQSGEITPGDITTPVPRGSLVVAGDDRLRKDFARVVPVGSVRGRVEGVLFSARVRKIGIDSFTDRN